MKAVKSTSRNLRFGFVLAVGQTDATWQWAELSGVKKTSEDAPSH
jgi:hypothetical protein